MRRQWFLAAFAGSLLLAASAPLRAAEHGGESNIFNADIGNFLFTLIIFGVVLYVLRKFAWSPLLNVLSKREETIRQSIEAARQERQQAERLLAEYKAHLDKARDEASAIVAEGRRDAEVAARRVQEQARKDAEEALVRARREIQLATDSARKELHDQAAELAVMVAARVLRKELSPTDHRALVAESLQEMAAARKPGTN